ncbi:MAG TPA: aminoglycoside phosphotransferase family protein [Acidimicrobiia bacterium]
MTSDSTRKRLRDPDLPGVGSLLGPGVPPPLAAAYKAVGTAVEEAEVVAVTWWPGRQLTVRFSVTGHGGGRPGSGTAVATIGAIPDGAVVVRHDDAEIGVWALPNDPSLPGLASALHLGAVNELLAGLGAPERATSTYLRAYRPSRRAVVQVEAGTSSIYLKVVPPDEAVALHDRHRHLASTLPVPESLGVSADLGVVVMRSLPGEDLRTVLRRGAAPPQPAEIVAIPQSLPDPVGSDRVSSPLRSVDRLTDLLTRITPECRPLLESLRESIGPETVEAAVATHGDFHESQILVDRGRIQGLVDVDTYGWGRPGDDAATMLAHLDLLSPTCRRPEQVRDLALALNRHWDGVLDPVDLRRRVAAVVLGLAVGPFRVQRPQWPTEVADRIATAARWVESARLVDERSLITSSGVSHGHPAS